VLKSGNKEWQRRIGGKGGSLYYYFKGQPKRQDVCVKERSGKKKGKKGLHKEITINLGGRGAREAFRA